MKTMNRVRKCTRAVLFPVTLLVSGGAVLAAPDGWSPLLEPAELAGILEHSDDVRVMRLTGEYEAGHIPGAVSIPYGQFRGPQDNPGQLPDLADLTSLLQQAGIEADTPVVLVHGGSGAVDMGAATRVYWTLRSLGVADLAVLNGGFSAWQSAQLPVSTEQVTVQASGYQPQWNDRWRVTTAELERLVNDDAPVRLVDARPEPYFQGQQASASRAGTIPGSENLSFTGWFDGNRMKSEDELGAMLSADGEAAVTFCNTGHLGSINWFVMNELAGQEGTRLYAESVTEWAMSPDRPMENEPRDRQ
ncbi:MAG: rhodanese-like domain-containing protein [Pseudohongiellaceae bacterium]